MISEFIEPDGQLALPNHISEEQQLVQRLVSRYVTEILECGGDKWWNQEYLVEQVSIIIIKFLKKFKLIKIKDIIKSNTNI